MPPLTSLSVTTYSQPPESLGAIQSMPYTARVPASSNCVTYQSQNLYAAANTASPTASVSGSRATGAAGSATNTGSGASASATKANGAVGVVPRLGAVIALAAFAAVAS